MIHMIPKVLSMMNSKVNWNCRNFSTHKQKRMHCCIQYLIMVLLFVLIFVGGTNIEINVAVSFVVWFQLKTYRKNLNMESAVFNISKLFSSLKISCYVLHCEIANNNIPHWHNIMYKKLSLGATKHMCTVMVSRLRIYDLLLTNTILLNDSIHSKYISTQFLNNIKQTY